MKKIRLYTLVALLLMAGGVTMQAQEYESYFGADSTRLNVFEECIMCLKNVLTSSSLSP